MDIINFSIRKKFFAILAAIAISYLITIVVSTYQVIQIKETTNHSYFIDVEMNLNQELLILLEKIDKDIDKFFTVGPVEYRENALESINQTLRVLDEIKNINKTHEHLPSKEVLELETILIELNSNFQKLIEIDRNNPSDTNNQVVVVYSNVDKAREVSKKLLEGILAESSHQTQEQQNLTTSIIGTFIFLGASLIPITVLMIYILKNSILRPIELLQKASMMLSRGNYDYKLDMRTGDEFGNLAATFNKMSSQIKESTNALEEEKARLLAAIKNMPLGFILVDERQNIVLSNSKVEEILRMESSPTTCEEVNKQINGELDMSKLCASSQDSGQLTEVGEVETVNNRFIKILISPVEINHIGKKSMGAIVLIEDITEAKLLNQTRDEFFAVASHELRTPLTSVRGNISLIKQYFGKETDNKDLKEMLDDIHSSSVRLIELVEDFLDVSRLEQNKIELSPESFDITSLIDGAVREMEKTATEKGLTFKFDNPNKELVVYADKNRVSQVIINLIGNAIKFTDEGEVRVEATMESGMVKVRVADSGVGISPENQKMLFRKFTQAGKDPLTRDATRGSGLGLYISKLLIEGMGGTIGLERSEPGKGSTFTFSLPISKNKEEKKSNKNMII